MGRRGDKAPGETEENARHRRARMRKDTVVIREDFCLELYAAGWRVPDIAKACFDKFGIFATPDSLYRLLPRALARRAELRGGAEDALERYLEGLEQLLRAHMPRAVGGTDEDGNPIAPDVRAADVVLKVLDRMAEVSGARKRPEQHITNNNTLVLAPGGDRAVAEADVLRRLAAEREKLNVVEGELAGVGTGLQALTSGEQADDTMAPPPGVAA